jgi:hypothetical protein
VIEQGEVGDGQWRIVRFKMEMSGRVFIKTRSFDTAEEQSQFARVPANLTYQQAIEILRAGQKGGPDARGKGRVLVTRKPHVAGAGPLMVDAAISGRAFLESAREDRATKGLLQRG